MATHILVVEDDPENADLIELALTVRGYEVWRAENAEQALTQIHTAQPDLILLDLMLPGMSGLELAQQLRGQADTQSIPILALTALAQQRDFEQAAGLGIEDYVTKPFEPQELRDRIAGVLARSAGSVAGWKPSCGGSQARPG